jgi:hypothetical protein
MTSEHAKRRARQPSGQQADERRIKEVNVENIDLAAMQHTSESEHGSWVPGSSIRVHRERRDSKLLEPILQPAGRVQGGDLHGDPLVIGIAGD